MALGPGKYDDACSAARKAVGITDESGGAVLLIVVGGNRGNGFSCQADLDSLLVLAETLENVVAQLRRDGPFV